MSYQNAIEKFESKINSNNPIEKNKMKVSQLFIEHSKQTIDYNGSAMNLAYYNIIVSIRDLKLWEVGMKPDRHWYVTDVKKYFGLVGRDKTKIRMALEKMRDDFNH